MDLETNSEAKYYTYDVRRCDVRADGTSKFEITRSVQTHPVMITVAQMMFFLSQKGSIWLNMKIKSVMCRGSRDIPSLASHANVRHCAQ